MEDNKEKEHGGKRLIMPECVEVMIKAETMKGCCQVGPDMTKKEKDPTVDKALQDVDFRNYENGDHEDTKGSGSNSISPLAKRFCSPQSRPFEAAEDAGIASQLNCSNGDHSKGKLLLQNPLDEKEKNDDVSIDPLGDRNNTSMRSDEASGTSQRG